MNYTPYCFSYTFSEPKDIKMEYLGTLAELDELMHDLDLHEGRCAYCAAGFCHDGLEMEEKIEAAGRTIREIEALNLGFRRSR